MCFHQHDLGLKVSKSHVGYIIILLLNSRDNIFSCSTRTRYDFPDFPIQAPHFPIVSGTVSFQDRRRDLYIEMLWNWSFWPDRRSPRRSGYTPKMSRLRKAFFQQKKDEDFWMVFREFLNQPTFRSLFWPKIPQSSYPTREPFSIQEFQWWTEGLGFGAMVVSMLFDYLI